jgi:hypothetical protein
MQVLRAVETESATPVGHSIRTMVLTAGASETSVQRIAGLGCSIECEAELFSALDKLLSDPSGYGLFIMDADAFGGLASGHRAFRLLGEVAQRVPMIMFSAECRDQVFPDGRESPTILRAPLSAISLRVGFEHALRARTALYV